MNDEKKIIAIAGSMDWHPIESKNPLMFSFSNDITEERVNVYFTTGTVTRQAADGICNTYRNVTEKQFEIILTI